jgi:tRNA1(Val) A37 N6-methylase TrmN6
MDKSVIKPSPIGNGINIYVTKHHTFGTDAVVLSHFAKPKKSDNLLDLGTGCGIIPFLMLRDGAVKSAIGVDISSEAISLCHKTKEEYKFSNFTPVLSDLNDLKGKVEFGCHSLITCNPPYKVNGAGIKNPDKILEAARHETLCTLEDIVTVSAKLLKTSGRLCICHRPERLTDIMFLLREKKIEPKRLRLVCQRKGEEPWLVLVEGRRCGNKGLRIEPTLYIEDNGKLSKEMTEIYGAYKEGYL